MGFGVWVSYSALRPVEKAGRELSGLPLSGGSTDGPSLGRRLAHIRLD